MVSTGKTGTIGRFFPKDWHELSFRAYVGNETSLPSSFAQSDASLVHAAAIVGHGKAGLSPSETVRVNVNEASRLADEAASLGFQRFIFVSTSHVYGPLNRYPSESDQVNPASFYAETKARAEEAVAASLKGSSTRLTVLRVFSVLGLDDPEGTLSHRMRLLAQGQPGILKFARDERDFLSPSQVAGNIETLLTVPILPSVLNVCTGKAMSLEQVGNHMTEALGQRRDSIEYEKASSTFPHQRGNSSLLISLHPGCPQDFRLTGAAGIGEHPPRRIRPLKTRD